MGSEDEEKKTIAFVYKWVHKPSLNWYIGSRTRKGCHPNDGYICSSRVVKPMIQCNPHDWVRTVIKVGSPEEMLELETDILSTFDAKNDARSFNMHNGDGKFSWAGKLGPMIGRKHTDSAKEKMKNNWGTLQKRKSPKTYKHSEFTKQKISKTLKEGSAPNIGKTGEKNPNFKGIIAATFLSDGTIIYFNGKMALLNAGFNPSAVYRCIKGKRNFHKGCTFKLCTQEDNYNLQV